MRVSKWIAGAAAVLAGIVLTGTAHALTVSPSRQALLIDAGETGEAKISVVNNSEIQQTYLPSAEGFGIDEKNGLPEFGLQDTALEWITALPQSLTLAPGQKGEFVFSISVPENAEVRSRYLALFAEQKGGEGQVGVSARVGSLLFLHIGGQAREELGAEEFYADRKIVGRLPFSPTLILKNNGTIHVVPDGEIVVVNGRNKVVEQSPLSQSARKVLPGERWQESYVLSGLTLKDIGKISVHALVRYGQSGQTLTHKMTFWFIPWYVQTVAAGVLGFAAAALVRNMIRRRRTARIR